jgi:dTDP-4-dehydrorhamnose reductase
VRILVLGATGMLGHKLYQVLASDHEVWACARRRFVDVEALGLFESQRFLGGARVEEDSDLATALERSRADVVINCVGVVKQVAAAQDPIAEIEINALLPHRLHRICRDLGVRLLHFSTDCVYSGAKGHYSEEDPADAEDLYGRTKLLGELDGPQALTIRTSIIGREIFSGHGLVEWFLSQPGPSVRGFVRAVFSGLPTLALAEAVRDILLPRSDLVGVWHLSSDPITKHDLLRLLAEAFERDLELIPVNEPVIDRSLNSSRLRSITPFMTPPWPMLVRALASDPSPYEVWRAEASYARVEQ